MFAQQQRIVERLEQINNTLHDLFRLVTKLVHKEEPVERLTFIREPKDASQPLYVGVHIDYIRTWTFLEGNILKVRYSNGDLDSYYGKEALTLLNELGLRSNVYGDEEKEVVENGTDSAELDHDPFL